MRRNVRIISILSVLTAVGLLAAVSFWRGEHSLPPETAYTSVSSTPSAVPPLSFTGRLSAEAAIVIDANSGSVLYEKNADKTMYPASTTKIMTGLLAAECLDPDEVIAVPEDVAKVEGSSIYLNPREKLTADCLIHGLLLNSGNDAAYALAVACAGSVEAFAERMNERAAALGMTGTHFVNPHGLPDDAHYTTARDLARLAANAMKNEYLRKVVSTVRASYPSESGTVRYFVNHNRLLTLYDGAVGVKTGYTREAGRCLVSAAMRDGNMFIAVTLGDPDDWNDHVKLLDAAFDECETLYVAPPDAFFLDVGDKRYANHDGVFLTVPRGTAKDCKTDFTVIKTPDTFSVHYTVHTPYGTGEGDFSLSPSDI